MGGPFGGPGSLYWVSVYWGRPGEPLWKNTMIILAIALIMTVLILKLEISIKRIYTLVVMKML